MLYPHAGRYILAFLAFLAFATIAIVITLSFADPATSSEVLPEDDLLTLACDRIEVQAAVEGVQIGSCRRNAPDQIEGRRAIIHVSVKGPYGRVAFSVFFVKSLWAQQGIMVEA